MRRRDWRTIIAQDAPLWLLIAAFAIGIGAWLFIWVGHAVGGS